MTSVCCMNALLLKAVLCPAFLSYPFSLCSDRDHGIVEGGGTCQRGKSTVAGVRYPQLSFTIGSLCEASHHPSLPWSGFPHLQDGYSNLSCCAPYLWCEKQMRKCERLIAKPQKAFCTKAGEEAAAQAIHTEVLRPHPRGSAF